MLWSIDSCQNRISADQIWSLTWSLDRIAGSGVDPIEVKYFYEVIRWQVNSFQMIEGSSLLFQKFHMKCVVFIAAQLKFWFQSDLGREKSASYYRQLVLTFLTLVTRWSRSTSNFYALIGQYLTGEFIRKIYAASLILFNLTAEEERVLCQLVFVFCFFNCLFPRDIQNEIQLLSWVFCYSWLACLLSFWLRNTSLVHVGNPISNGIIFVFHLAWCMRGLKSLKRYWPLDSFQELHREW